jgi:hypothetical protein
LGAGRGAVDLVRHQKLGEDGPLDEPEVPFAARILIQDLGAQYVRRHEIRRELHASPIEAEHGRHCRDQSRLGEAGRAYEKAVSARQDAREREFYHPILPENRLGNLNAGADKGFAHALRLGRKGGIGARFHDVGRSSHFSQAPGVGGEIRA